MAGGWPGSGSLSFRLSHLLSSSLPGSTRRHASAHGDSVRGDDAPPKPSKSARFPLKAAITASVLATTGDTVAQLFHRYKQRQALQEQQQQELQQTPQGLVEVLDGVPARVKQAADGVSLWDHDWQRAARMASYGFLIYGPLSQVWYEVLDHFMPMKNLTNLSLKVVANQVILGPVVITLVFAWNKLWEGRLEQLPELYRTRALQTLLDGWKFWIPASVLNFGVIPLQARVAFMSSCSIFWNFYLSNTMTAGKGKALPTSKSE
jgi:protein Mpv17